MALNKQDLISLMKTVSKADPASPVAYSFGGESYSYEALNETLRKELNELAGSYSLYRDNKNLIFSIIEEVIDDVLPKKVADFYSKFAEVRTFGQGDKPLFRRKVNARNRAKQFITRVGVAGVYEVFKLGGSESFEVPTSAIGAAAQIGFEEFLDGRVDWSELYNIILEGMDELIQAEIAGSLVASIDQLPANNKHSEPGFNEANFDRLITIASAYGTPVIYCTNEFAAKMIPGTDWGRYSDAMKEELWKNGRFANYKNVQVVIIPQGLTDETNTMKTIDPGYCWIIPSGGDNKPVKIAFEGTTALREVDSNADWSKEVHVYKKVGVVAMMTNDICVYIDEDLAGKFEI